MRFGQNLVDLESVKKAAAYYDSYNSGGGKITKKSNRGNRRYSLATMTQNFPFITNTNHLQKLVLFSKTGNFFRIRSCEKLSSITCYVEIFSGKAKADASVAIRFISDQLSKLAKEAISNGYIIHDDDLREMVSTIMNKNDIKLEFKASDSWMNNWKRAHRISSRRITKFVARSRFNDQAKLEQNSKDFVLAARAKMAQYDLDEVINCDQSGFQLEMHTARTLANTGSKKVEIVVKSVAATTHSFTMMPVLTASGKLHPILYILIKETGGRFPAKGHFQADNLVVEAGTTHIMKKTNMIHFFKNVVFHPTMPKKLLMLVDSWTSWDIDAIKAITPAHIQLEIMKIPPGTTGMIQPLDVGAFGNYKKIVKKFMRHAQRIAPNFVPHHRDNVFKVVFQEK